MGQPIFDIMVANSFIGSVWVLCTMYTSSKHTEEHKRHLLLIPTWWYNFFILFDPAVL